MLGLVFFSILGVFFQAGMLILSQQTLDAAVDRASRALFTGEFQEQANGSVAPDRLRTVMCNGWMFTSCDDLRFEVSSSATFQGAQPRSPYDDKTAGWNGDFGSQFSCPTGGQVVTIRAATQMPMFFSFLATSAQKMPDGKQLLTSTGIFRSEPHPYQAC